MGRLKPLRRSFYAPSAKEVAPQLLGHLLVCKTTDGDCGGIIVETEAYLQGDAACHGAPGPTKRNQVMFGPPGYAYVYLIYGFHYCFNTVCMREHAAEAVLVRAIEPTLRIDLMSGNRPVKEIKHLGSGPGKLCQAMRITRKLDGSDLCDDRSPLWIAKNPEREEYIGRVGPIVTTTRIGLTKAAALPLRFLLKASPFVSKPARS